MIWFSEQITLLYKNGEKYIKYYEKRCNLNSIYDVDQDICDMITKYNKDELTIYDFPLFNGN
jgi:aromatic ring-opening dioxygenase LigB subunit